MQLSREQARDQLICQVLRRLNAERLPVDDPHFSDELQYSDELIAHAARELTCAVDRLPAYEQPVGWSERTP